MMKANILYGWLMVVALVSLLVACNDGDDILGNIPAETKGGKITFYTSEYTADWEENTRSLDQVSDIIQKQIHNLYYFFYDAEGYLEKIYYQSVEPTMSVEVNIEDFKNEHEDDTPITPHGIVYIVANSQKLGLPENGGKPKLVSCEHSTEAEALAWRQAVPTVSEFQRQSMFPIFLGSAGVQNGFPAVGKPDHMIMFGYFDGTMLESKDLQVPLGRLAARMNIVLSGPGLGKQARITIENAPKYTSLYPSDTEFPEDFFTTFVETIDTGSSTDNEAMTDEDGVYGISCGNDGKYGGITGTSGNYSANLYYYCGENNYRYTNTPTTLKVETWDTEMTWGDRPNQRPDVTYVGSNARTYLVKLGNNSPDVEKPPYNEERDYNLHRNTSYTFNIILKE